MSSVRFESAAAMHPVDLTIKRAMHTLEDDRKGSH